ncbi:YggS family pyridoxal phosphate-dependent enzyme [soil metagenome]
MNLEYLKENLKDVKDKIESTAKRCNRNPDEIKLIAVSKNFPAEQIDFLNKSGQIEFGENKVQELSSKAAVLTADRINWHLIGHLQSNKVKEAVETASMIQSVDSLKIAASIQQHSEKLGRSTDILIQVNTSGEEQKSGCIPGEAFKLCENICEFPNLNLKGLMTIGKFTENEIVIRENFRLLRNIFDSVSISLKKLDFLSMGMTSDFEIAIEEGSNMLRIGSAIFGSRNYI